MSNVNRRAFLRAGMAAGIGGSLAAMMSSCAVENASRSGKGSMMGYDPKPKDLIKVGFVGIGAMGSGHVRNLLKIEGCQIAAVCDIRPPRTDWAKKAIVDAGSPEPKVYGKNDLDFVRMCETEDLDLVYNAAPWRWHAPICLAAMRNGKHAASEVNVALTLDHCWELVETSEKARKHCVMQENCCYDFMEMVVLNMIKKGMFGEILHGECGYLHDLRALLTNPNGYQGMWRWHQQTTLNGNLYPTHGIGPMAWCMDINRGDAFDTMVSFSSNSRGLHEYAVERFGPDHEMSQTEVACGDVNTCLIKTKKGKTIICKHDTHLPRPYSRDFLVQGTKGLVRKYPEQKIHIEGLTKGHSWEDFEKYAKEYEHPVWTQIKEKAKGAGHGGMDFIEDYRLINALRQGVSPDNDVYDSVAWSSIIPLSVKSVAKGGELVKFPDFTRGQWATPRALQVDKVTA
ncbi:MAG: Gfo/Idh/MocA family oxidoreductase [Sedimentisphaerales bacterium]|nr:Gfo/Idh/MocA family oxidoreductase [Sedimentisphaerales bacterium]